VGSRDNDAAVAAVDNALADVGAEALVLGGWRGVQQGFDFRAGRHALPAPERVEEGAYHHLWCDRGAGGDFGERAHNLRAVNVRLDQRAAQHLEPHADHNVRGAAGDDRLVAGGGLERAVGRAVGLDCEEAGLECGEPVDDRRIEPEQAAPGGSPADCHDGAPWAQGLPQRGLDSTSRRFDDWGHRHPRRAGELHGAGHYRGKAAGGGLGGERVDEAGLAASADSGDDRPGLEREGFVEVHSEILGPGADGDMENLTGLILAGGKSTRFGRDKASAPLAGRAMLQWMARALEPVCAGLVVVRARGQELPAIETALPAVVVEDEYDELGPLAGLVTGFGAVETELCFATSCDAPLLRPELVELLAARAAGHDIVCPLVERFLQPLVAVYRPATCLPVFRDFVERRVLKITAAFGPLRLDAVPEEDVRRTDRDLRSFRNANRPEEAAAIEAELLGGGSYPFS
jgi:molybdopterin-guanine dinucleotide biosynthesis protein A